MTSAREARGVSFVQRPKKKRLFRRGKGWEKINGGNAGPRRGRERVGLELGRRWKLFISFQRLMLETGVCYLVVRRKKGRINRSSSDLIRCGLSFVALQCEFFLREFSGLSSFVRGV